MQRYNNEVLKWIIIFTRNHNSFIWTSWNLEFGNKCKQKEQKIYICLKCNDIQYTWNQWNVSSYKQNMSHACLKMFIYSNLIICMASAMLFLKIGEMKQLQKWIK